MPTSFSQRALAAHVIKAMFAAQKQGERIDLDGLTALLQVRRGDVRTILSRLHEQHLLDLTTMRLTLQGFAIGSSLEDKALRPIRSASARRIAAA